ncbi:hypothetical protein M1O29_00215 [Dehalococcoidia bacterium]|nr:hypothetical protein [Dehalococcoidia bacterium]
MAKKPQRVRIMEQHRVTPLSLPDDSEIKQRLKLHPQAVRLREGKLHEWFTEPLEGGLWSAWGRRARPEARGMTYASMNAVSTSSEPPERGSPTLVLSRFIKTQDGSSDQVELTRGGAPKYGSTRELEDKYLVWVPEAGLLAEEALARQWKPSLHLKWHEMERLPEDQERALDQILTYLTQCQYFCSDVLGPYIGRMHYAFLEVKGYLAYELFDYNLHAGVMRKRMLSNGGGIGSQVDGFDAGVLEACNDASQGFEGEVDRDFNGTVFALDVLFNGIVLQMLRLAEFGAKSRFDRDLFTQMIQDEARHVSWGCKRIQYFLEHCPDREDAVVRLHTIADQAEGAQVMNHLLNPKVLEPLAVMLGGGIEQMGRGYAMLREFWPQFAEQYLARLDGIGLPRRDRCLIPQIAPF